MARVHAQRIWWEHQQGQRQGQGCIVEYVRDKGVCNGTRFCCGSYHYPIGGMIVAYKAHIGKLDWRYAIILLLYLSILVGSHIHWNTKGVVRTRKKVSIISKQTIQVAKAWQSLNITQADVYGSNYMYTVIDTCFAGANCRLFSLSNEVYKVSPFLDSYQPLK